MSYCDDCGTRKSDGLCPNCHEELYIAEDFAMELVDVDCSPEFLAKVEEQRRAVAKERAELLSGRALRERVAQK